MVEFSLNQKNIIITRSKDKISDIKKLFTNKGAQIFDFPAIDVGYPDDLNLSLIHISEPTRPY